MLNALQSLLAPAVMERLVLVINHVLGAEPQAQQRLGAHAGRSLALQLDNWPSLLPPLPNLAFGITPAGLLEWLPQGAQPAPDLSIDVDAANPAALAAQCLAGTPPAVDIRGDSQLAADVDWLLKNLRWDVAADLERLFGPVVAQELQRLGSMLARGMRGALETLSAFARRPRSPGDL